jgi:hypothetical protein
MRWPVALVMALVLAVALARAGVAAEPGSPPSAREELLSQQMHAYLDALVDMQLQVLKLRASAQQRESEWAQYAKPLWQPQAEAHASER